MNKIRVVAAMSGGVDSSVTAAILSQNPNFEVIGITINLWPKDASPGQKSCCGVNAMDDARMVANKIGIPYYALNMVNEFERGVIQPFINTYKNGQTPNPCIECNNHIKFGTLIAKAKSFNAQFVATGHFARLEHNERFQVFKAKDLDKDQSYTFYGLSQQQLSHIMLPLGNVTKTEVRKIAAEIGLSVAEKKESMDICFTSNYREFLAGRGITSKPGEFVTSDGKIVGLHNGYHNYTVGQRKGLGLSLGDPHYVMEIRPASNQVVVGTKEALNKTRFTIKDVNWSGIACPENPTEAFVKIRYGAELMPATLTPNGNLVTVDAKTPLWAASPGQSAAFYDANGMVLGGGYIS